MPVRLSDLRKARKRHLLIRAGLPALLLVACATTGAPRLGPLLPAPAGLAAPGEPLPKAARDWVDDTLASLDLEGRAAQLVMVWMSGGYASVSNEELVRVRSLVERGIGGIVISLGTPNDYVSRLNRLQAAAEIPLLVAADFEAGPGFRVGGVYALPEGLSMGGATAFPPAMAFGAVGDEALAYEAGRITAVEARAMGVHLNFAPVLDVNNNPANPIINTRSYGEDPERVAGLGAAYIRGARDAGLMTTAKHFPGHGDTETDSHEALPVIPGDRDRLESLELVPFRRAISAGVDAVMTAHVAAPAILGPGAPPATMSPFFMTELLRGELGFRGVLFTDALDMGAIVAEYGPEEAPIRALEAGADILLMPAEPERAIAAVAAAVRSGRIEADRLEASVRRVLEMKARAGLHLGRFVDPDVVTRVVGTAEHTDFADSVARRSLALVRDETGAVPIDSVAIRVLSLTVAPPADAVAGRVFDGRLSSSAIRLRRVRVDPASVEEAAERLLRTAGEADLVVLSVYAAPSRDPDDEGPGPLERLLTRLDLAGRRTIVVSFGSPYVLSAIPDASTYLVAWGGTAAAQRSAADALLGRTDVTGRLPISLPPAHALGAGLRRRHGAGAPRASDVPLSAAPAETDPSAVGMDARALERVDRLIELAIADSVTPGAALAVGRHGRLVRLRGYGRLDWDPASGAVDASSLYDLASLTKVVATTTTVMDLVDRGRLDLDARVASSLPEWGDDWKAGITVRDLLLHRAGLPPFRPFWRDHRGRDAYRAAIDSLPAEYEIGARTVYSDLGLVALQLVIESLEGAPLDDLARRRVFGPLGMTDTGFNPPASERVRIAPTEIDTVFRHRHVHGEVHDENAFAMGGVAGHAGLFSSARDLARFAEWILSAAREGRGLGERRVEGSERLPSPGVVAEFTRRAGDASSRALGWDTPSAGSSSGRFFSASSFGHTGFTGTSIWVDPERDVFVVLLTNRVDPTRAQQGHIPLRRAVHDAVALALRDVAVEPREDGR